MCGIIGTTNSNVSLELVTKGLLLLNRRGPDFNNIIKKDNIVFGHTRLAIIDLEERSNQPFTYCHKGKSILLTFNGEIYNYISIKNELSIKGYEFATNSDTEVIAASFLEWGASCFDHFIGMWAIAIKSEGELILSRDRVGKKPFYYSVSDKRQISFSSSMKALALITDQYKIDKKGLELYFALGYTPAKYSILENIFKVEPGEIFVFSKIENDFILKKSFRSTFVSSVNTEKIKKLIQNSVDKRVISDVPITTLMSGGVDSTIVSVLTKSIKKDLECFFVDFEDKKLSERKWADYLAKRNCINLTRVIMTDDDLKDGFHDFYKAYEEPFADYSGIPSIAIFKKVSEKFKVVLTGDGGDELFYGYPHYFKKMVLYKFFWLFKIFRKNKFIPAAIKNIVNDNKENFESNYLKNHGIVTQFCADLINNAFNQSIERNNGFLRGIIDFDRVFYNWPDKYLVKVDRASMYSSVEVRSPFMDEDLLDKVKKTPLLVLFTPYSKKLYLKIKYFKLFGLKYFSAKKNGFTPPIQKLRNEYFTKEDFTFTKIKIKSISLDLYNEMLTITFDDLKKDKILFDRFFFFHEWLKINKNNYNVQK